MEVPEYITEQIEKRFGGRFRLRWSPVEEMFLFEQKVRRGVAEGFAPLSYKNGQQRRVKYEDQVRARDGYVLTMQISPGTRARCPHCNTEFSVPAFKAVHRMCPICAARGKQVPFVGGYWPLSDSLLDELDRMDNNRGGHERVMAAAAKKQKFAERERDYALNAPIEAAFRERFNRLVGIPQTGRTRVMTGTEFGNFGTAD